MGIAAYNRGSSVIRRTVAAQSDQRRRDADRREAVRLSVELDGWRRDALAMIADPPRSAMGRDITRRKGGRVAEARRAHVCRAHAAWLDANTRDAYGYLGAAREYAQTVYRYLSWLTRAWENPCLKTAPKSARA